MESIAVIVLRLAAASSANTPVWGDYALLVLMTVFVIGAVVFAWRHWEH
jgi:membrane protein YdbS with pleckstrin-like domain